MNKNDFINYYFSLSGKERKEIIKKVDELDLKQNTKIYKQNNSYLNKKEKKRLRGIEIKKKVKPGMFVKCEGTKDGFGIREVLSIDDNGITARMISRKIHIISDVNVPNEYYWFRDSYITTHQWNKVVKIIKVKLRLWK